jgi:energy-coupling factor transporter ATP-binding protein EcfA2
MGDVLSRLDFWLTGGIILLLAIAYARRFYRRMRGSTRPKSTAPATSPHEAPQGTPAPLPTGRILAHAEWFGRAVDAVHLLIVGPTDAGKSTTALAVVGARVQAGGQVLILDPHAAPADWLGLTAIGAGRDYAAIDRALVAVLAELDTRYTARGQGVTSFQRLTVFVDEVPAISQNCEHWRECFSALSSEGRKVGLSLVALTQSRLVDLLGIKGRSDLRENFAELLLAESAVKVLPATADLARPAALDYRGNVYAVDVSHLPRAANVRVDPACIWPIPVSPAMPQSGPDTSTNTDTSIGSIADTDAVNDDTTVRRARAIRKAHQAGVSKNDIAVLLGGNRNRTLDLINRALSSSTDKE